uniref:WD_REPEATS_REGION domain-containing protein n=1 Tax=Rhabditophanes sp. KR3021 TaxID=114890 RepID=A0AC35UHV9_9BILA
MKFELTYSKYPPHTGPVTGMCWVNSEGVVSIGDDQQFLTWDMGTVDSKPWVSIKGNYPTSMHVAPGYGIKSGLTNNNSTLLIATATGMILIIRGGKIDKTIQGHKGASLKVKWSEDGSSFISCGEEGEVKLWSKNGLIRSVLAKCDHSVYAIAWNPDDSKVLYCSGEYCYVKSLKLPTAPLKWKAHEGTITCCDWAKSTNLMVTGGEDCKYRVWDGQGRIIYTSVSHDYPITSLAWNPNGKLFGVGSFNILRLCDKLGWSHSIDKLMVGSILTIDWSRDGTQIAAGSAAGYVIHGQLVEQRLIWNNLDVLVIANNVIEVKSVLSETMIERLETRDRIITLSIGYGFLIAVTTKQVYLFHQNNWILPKIIELKEGNVFTIMQAKKYFLLLSNEQIEIMTYEGHAQALIKLNIQTGSVNEKLVALSDEIVAVIDSTETKIINLFEASTGKALNDGKIEHVQEIIEIGIDKIGSGSGRKVAFIDNNRDLYLSLVHAYGVTDRIQKLASNISEFKFHDKTNMMVALQDQGKVLVFAYPNIVFVDSELLADSIITIDLPSIGKSPSLISFLSDSVYILKSTGAIISKVVPQTVQIITDSIGLSKWDQVIRICRSAKEPYLWAVVAGLAVVERNVAMAEVSYSELDRADKVLFLTRIRTEKNAQLKNAYFAMFAGRISEAEGILLNGSFIFKAIYLNIQMFRWERALQLALKYNEHVDTVLGYRQRYMNDIEEDENDDNFLAQYKQVSLDFHFFIMINYYVCRLKLIGNIFKKKSKMNLLKEKVCQLSR